MLTPRQRAAYDFVLRFSDRKGYAPSYDEIRRHLGLASLNAVAKLIAQLRRRGYLVEAPRNAKRWLAAPPDRADPDRRGSLAGGIRPGRSPESRRRPEATTVPLLGTIAAGLPIEAIETPEELEVPPSLLGRASAGDRYALRVRGDSMIGDGIHDGDVIVVRRARRAENGETVVAIVDGEATLKRWHVPRADTSRGSRWIELRPANAAMKPIRVAADRVEIRGVLVGLLRRYD